MPFWALTRDVADRMQHAQETGNVPTLAQQVEYETAYRADNANGPRILSVKGSTADIQVTGILTGAPDLLAKWFGGGNTTYSEIRAALAAAETDQSVKTVNLQISSPGGEASSEWLATMDAIAASSKPTTASVGTMAASAAFGIASQANKITAQNKMSMVGSIGVVTSRRLDSSVVTITSTDAPLKRPDVSTEDGQAAVRTELDAMHNIFAGTVAKGRGVSVEAVNTKFGRGGMLLAADAVAVGMIDSVKAVNHPLTADNTGTQGVQIMDLAQLKAEHPAVFLLAVAEGISAERDRVNAHLVMGEASASMPLALKAVAEGTAMTETLRAQYFAAGLNVRDGANRAAESAAAAVALDGANKGGGDAVSDEDTIAALVAQQLGLEVK